MCDTVIVWSRENVQNGIPALSYRKVAIDEIKVSWWIALSVYAGKAFLSVLLALYLLVPALIKRNFAEIGEEVHWRIWANLRRDLAEAEVY